MTYVVLARKYRPRRFTDMVGQESVVTALTNALRQQRLHHAYLFTGTRGIGKTTVSRILAKSLNCTGLDGQGGVTTEPCGHCEACTQIDQDRYIDYIELDAASNRSIDEIRDLLERAAYRPSTGRFKVFMIDEAHQLTKDAFNALLKTLEEPPPYLKFVLATTDPEKMLPTVLSRCLQFNLRPLAPEVVAARLRVVLEAEQVPCDDAALRLLGKAARGSLRDGLSLTDQAIAYGGGQVVEGSVRRMLGLAADHASLAVLEALARADAAAVVAHCSQWREQGQPAGTLIDAWIDQLHRLAVELAVPGTLAADPEAAPLRALASAWLPANVHLLYSLLVQGRRELGLAPDEHTGLQMLLLRYLAFASPSSTPPVVMPRRTEPAASVTPAEVGAGATVSPSTPTVSAEEPPWSALAPEDLVSTADADPGSGDGGDRRPDPDATATLAGEREAVRTLSAGTAHAMQAWARHVRALCESQRVSALVRELAVQSECVSCAEPQASGAPWVWTLHVEREPLLQGGLALKLAEALADVVPGAHRVEVRRAAVNDSVTRQDAQARLARQQEAESLIRDDPVVSDLLQAFPGARIVPSSIHPV